MKATANIGDIHISEEDMMRIGFSEYESGQYTGDCIMHVTEENIWIETVNGNLCYDNISKDDYHEIVKQIN